MPSTTALFTGLSGLNANARNIDVIGNNIANVNTTAFKSSRLMFSTMFSQTLRDGTAPDTISGGTNPYQIGLGVMTAGTQRNMGAGSINPTGDPRDLAIDGDGFFVVSRDAGSQYYTRAGGFRPDANGVLTTVSGERLLGYAIDDQFNIQTGSLQDITIPIGQMTLAAPTSNVLMAGNLNANGALATQGSTTLLRGAATAGLSAIASASPAPTPPNLIETTTRLIDIEDPAQPGGNSPLFAAGQQIQLRDAMKGGKTIPAATFDVSDATTLADLGAFLTQALGIDTTTGANPDGATPGVSLDPATGVLSIVGNTGTVNSLSIDASDVRLLDPAGTLLRYPFNAEQAAAATGESVRTTVVVYDSLGTPVEMDASMVLDSRSNTGTAWRYYVQSADDSDLSPVVATGLLNFDTQGRLLDTTPVPITLDRAGTGADSPISISLAFTDGSAGITALTSDTSSLAAVYRDGSSLGTLNGFSVGRDGIITGSFSNGLTRTIGQVVLATFANSEGLTEVGDNLFTAGANSGPAVLAAPGTLGSGSVAGGALELSNVDLGEEFIKLILSSTGYSASSRVIKTTDELMQQLLVIGR